MTARTRFLILLIVLVCLFLIVRQVRRRRIRARYLVLWVSLCTVILPLVAIPRVADEISNLVGIYYPPATFLMAAIIILFLVTIDFSAEISKLDERTRILAEELALAQVTPPYHRPNLSGPTEEPWEAEGVVPPQTTAPRPSPPIPPEDGL